MRDPMDDATPHLDADQLLDLVLGLASSEVRRSRQRHITTCASCERRLREMAASDARAQAHQAEALARAMRGGPLAGGRGGVRRMPRVAVLTMALAAACAVFVGLFALMRPAFRSPDRVPEAVAWLPAPRASGLARGGDAGEADTLLFAGLAAYEAHDLATARRLLKASRATEVLEQVRRVYLGSALLHLGEAKPALEQLQSLDYAALPEPWRGESRWAMGQALARAGRKAEADSLVHQLASEPGPIGDRARGSLRLRAP